jgi:hypothetical protein
MMYFLIVILPMLAMVLGFVLASLVLLQTSDAPKRPRLIKTLALVSGSLCLIVLIIWTSFLIVMLSFPGG